jgi:hypothetical protein
MMARMRVTHSVRYDAPLGEVRAMLLDPAFREKAAWAQQPLSVRVAVTGAEVTIELENDLAGVPSFVRSFAGSTLHTVQAERWSGNVAEFSITSPGKPGGVHGRRVLVEDGSACLDTFEGDAKVPVPFIGRKIEPQLEGLIREGWDEEHVVGTGWLAGER